MHNYFIINLGGFYRVFQIRLSCTITLRTCGCAGCAVMKLVNKPKEMGKNNDANNQ